MLCQKCKKNIATIHMTEIADGLRKDLHICEQCAIGDFISPDFRMSLADLIKSLTKDMPFELPFNNGEATRPIAKEPIKRKCRACGAKYSEFNISTEFGCPHDYQIFNKHIDRLLREFNNGSCVHSGKLPLRSLEKTRKDNRSLILRMRIDDAVRSEKYELAAEMRDQLNQL